MQDVALYSNLQHQFYFAIINLIYNIFCYASLAQLVEQLALNQRSQVRALYDVPYLKYNRP